MKNFKTKKMKQLKDLNAEVLSAKEMGSINGGLLLNAGSLSDDFCSAYTFIWGDDPAPAPKPAPKPKPKPAPKPTPTGKKK